MSVTKQHIMNFGLLNFLMFVNFNTHCYATIENNRTFPKGFLFGVATSAYQTEGAWNVDGKGENIWDRYIHENPKRIQNSDNADVACDSYHKYKEDIALAASLGFSTYRFSIAWSRILPLGYKGTVDEAGLKFYENLVNEIVKHNMIPMGTLYHFDLPQQLQKDFGGWASSKLVSKFVDYARIVIKCLDKVGYWITINEPRFCRFGYGDGSQAPGVKDEEYECDKTVLLAHAAVYRMYKREFPLRKAKMSLSLDCQWSEPKTKDPKDIAAAQRVLLFDIGVFAHPIFIGGWPKVVEERIAKRSSLQNLPKSRLPKLTKEEIEFINGTFDFLGVNHYLTQYVEDIPEENILKKDHDSDVRALTTEDPTWEKTSMGHAVTSWGARKILKWLKETYHNPEIFITEFGFSDVGILEDNDRMRFSTQHLTGFLDAMYIDKVNVSGALMWSIIDNFEWNNGYREHFGIFYINHTDPNKTRIPKKSTVFFKKLTSTGRIPQS